MTTVQLPRARTPTTVLASEDKDQTERLVRGRFYDAAGGFGAKNWHG
jgi:hypothetical protein